MLRQLEELSAIELVYLAKAGFESDFKEYCEEHEIDYDSVKEYDSECDWG